MPQDETEAARCRDMLRKALVEVQLNIAGWRKLPVDAEACGVTARANMPRIEQVFVTTPGDGDAPTPEAFRHKLYLARRRATQRLQDVPAFYIVSLSADSIGYKGMVLPSRLPQLYPDPVSYTHLDVYKRQVQAALRHPRHAGARPDRPHPIQRLRAPDQLERACRRQRRQRGHDREHGGISHAAGTQTVLVARRVAVPAGRVGWRECGVFRDVAR